MTSINLNSFDERFTELENIKVKINKYLEELSTKYDHYYMKYYRMNLATLTLSSLITFVNALSVLLMNSFGDYNLIDFSGKLVSLFLSSAMTLCTSIIRFRNYRDRLEKIKETIDKLHVIKTRIGIDTFNNNFDNIPEILQDIGNINLVDI